VLAGAVLAIALAVTPAGAEVRDWIEDGLGGTAEQRPTSPAIGTLPGGGELLVRSAGNGAWVVRSDGSRRRLGPYGGVSWSPNGLFVAGVRGRQLVAVTPEGELRWALTQPNGVARPRWSPSGLRIAYLSGSALRVVSGRGTGDAELIRAVGPVAPAWRPGNADELAFADASGRIGTVSAVTGAALWRSRTGVRPDVLVWSSDGERLAAIADGSVRIYDAAGRPVTRLRPRRGRFIAGAYSPSGRRLALVERHGGRSSVLLGAERTVFATATALRDLVWSPDGRWLLASSPVADQWLFLRSRRPHRVVAVSGVSRQFDPSGRRSPFPGISGWCCAP
jgi:WD40 repeat protein